MVLFEFRRVDARTGPAEVAAEVGGAGVVRQQLGLFGEVRTGANLFECILQTLFCRGVVDDFVRLHENMANFCLLDFAALHRAAQVINLDDMKAAGGADRRRYVALAHVLQHVDKNRGYLLALHPAQRSAFERRRSLRVARRHFPEVRAVLNLRVDLVGERFGLGHVVGARGFGDRQENMGEFVLGVDDDIAFEVRNALFDFTLRHADALADFDTPQLGDGDLLAQRAAKLGILDAIFRQQDRQLFESHVVLGRNTGNRLVQHLVGNLEADAGGTLQLDLRDDQTFEHLVFEHVFGRELQALALRVLANHVELIIELGLEDDTFVDDGGHAVQELARFGELVGDGDRR